jgi:hypothetical protein
MAARLLDRKCGYEQTLLFCEKLTWGSPRFAHRDTHSEPAAEHFAKLVGQRRHPALRGSHRRLVVRVGIAHEHVVGLNGHGAFRVLGIGGF